MAGRDWTWAIKKLAGPGASQHLSYARKLMGQLRERMERGGIDNLFWNRKRPDGTEVIVGHSHGRNFVYITVPEPETGEYDVRWELFTSEGIEANIEPVTSIPWYAYDYTGTYSSPKYVCGRGHSHHFVKYATTPRIVITSTPLVDMCSSCPSATGWDEDPCNSYSGVDSMQTFHYWAPRRLHQYQWWPNNNGNTFMISNMNSTQGQMQGLEYTSFSYLVSLSGVKYDAYSFVDQLEPQLWAYDDLVKPTYRGGPNVAPRWQHGAMQTVGGQDYVIMVDENGTFYCWEGEDSTNGNPSLVPLDQLLTISGSYQTSTPSYGAGFLGRWKWHFNSTGTKAVCVGYETFASANHPDTSRPCYIDNIYGAYNIDEIAYPAYAQAGAEKSPWLVEVDITIVNNGPGSFTLNASVSRTEKFSTTGIYYVDADYLFADTRLPAAADTLNLCYFDIWTDGLYGPNASGTTYWQDIWIQYTNSAFIFATDNGVGGWTDQLSYPQSWKLPLKAQIQAASQAIDWDGGGTDFVTLDTYGLETAYLGSDPQRIIQDSVVLAINCRTNAIAFSPESDMSWVGGVFQETYEIFNYGQFYKRYTYSGSQDPLRDMFDGTYDWDPAAMTTAGMSRLDKAHREVWNFLFGIGFRPHKLRAFIVHPNGHWAYSDTGRDYAAVTQVIGFMPDIFVARNKAGTEDTVFTNEELYNTAFGDTRDKSYYGPNANGVSGVWCTSGVIRSPLP